MEFMPQQIRVVTLNTWKCDGDYRNRLHWMADGLLALRPDILCLQEAFMCEETRDDTTGFLAAQLSMSFECLRSRRKHRDVQNARRDSWSNLAILSSMPLQRLPDIKLTEIDADNDRWAMQAIANLSDNRRIHLINTHLTHVRGPVGDAARSEQAKQIAALCKAHQADATVCCGDFNAERESDALQDLWSAGFEKPKRESLGGTFQGPCAKNDLPSRRIDYIEIKAKTPGALRFEQRRPALNAPVGPNGEYPSDHAALVADCIFEDIRQRADTGVRK